MEGARTGMSTGPTQGCQSWYHGWYDGRSHCRDRGFWGVGVG